MLSYLYVLMVVFATSKFQSCFTFFTLRIQNTYSLAKVQKHVWFIAFLFCGQMSVLICNVVIMNDYIPVVTLGHIYLSSISRDSSLNRQVAVLKVAGEICKL